MVDLTLPSIMTPKEIAEYLKVDEATIIQQLETGNLGGFQVGSEWRSSDAEILEYISKHKRTLGAAMKSLAESLTTPKVETASGFTEIGPFDFDWPQSGGGPNLEHYDKGYETTRMINGRHFTFTIGFGNRKVAGRMRARVTIWLGNRAIVEFAGSNNFEIDELLASIIKLKDNTQLTPYQEVPPEYKDFRVARYNSIVQGPYASTNMAIVVHKDDLESMLRHAIIRGLWKRLI